MDFSTVTEQPRQRATRSQIAMLRTRYAWAAGHAEGKDTLEVACGAGMGLAALAAASATLAAGDIDEANCAIARANHPKIDVRVLDASALPFADASFDLVALFEAIYYLPDARRALREAYRVLRPSGALLISTANPARRGFNPSPLHTRYFTASELSVALGECGFRVRLFAGFPESPLKLVGAIRRTAVAFGVIPRTMRGKVLLKRVFYGPLEPIPDRIAARDADPLIAVDASDHLSSYSVLYAEAYK